MSDIVARTFHDPLHHFEHWRDKNLHDIRFIAHDSVRDPVRQKQDVFQSIEKIRRDLIIFILFFYELKVKRYLCF